MAASSNMARSTRRCVLTESPARANESDAARVEQLPSAAGDGSALEALLRTRSRRDDDVAWPETLARARDALEQATWSLPFPDSAEPVGVALTIGGGETGADSVYIAYLAAAPLAEQAAQVLGAILRRDVGHPLMRTTFTHAGPATFAVEDGDTAAVERVIALSRRYPGLHVGVIHAPDDSAVVAAALGALRAAGVDSVAVEARAGNGPLRLRLGRRRG